MANRENVLKLLRNTTLFSTRQDALNYIATMKDKLGDGEFWASTYGQTDSVKSILAFKHQGGVTIFDMDAVSSDITTQINNAINGLAAIARTGNASDAATTAIPSSTTSVAVTGTNAAAQIASLAQTMKTVQDNASKYKLVALTSEEIAALSDANVKEAYKIVSYTGADQQSVPVKIYKDSSLKEVYLGANTDTINASTGVITKNTVTDPQSLNFAYQLADGTYSLVKIDVSKFLTQSEFKDGLTVSGNGEVSVNIDSTSDKDDENNSFLSVSSNGVKLSGVKAAFVKLKQDIEDTELTISASLNDLETRKANKADIEDFEGEFNTFKTTTESAISTLTSGKADKSELQTLSDSVLTSVAAGNGITVSQKSGKSQTVSLKLDTVQTDNALSLSNNGLYFSKTIDCGEY